ncbi:MAG TPA: hypothetical protein VGR19_07115 [Allosphingosinicella sp.]|nr:hypothetical protein [Allosphingosinicella sp.]
MRLSDARIGYGGYSADFRHPGDRRRFAAYAAQKGIGVERAQLGRAYDLVLLTHNADLTGWTHRKRAHGDFKFVFELVDSYFVQHVSRFPRLLKGTARRLMGMETRLSADFLKTLIAACEAADAVICATPEQRAIIERYNPNVILSFDYFGGDLEPPKADYSRSGKLRLAWEGQSTTLFNVNVIQHVLNELKEEVELHVVTDPEVYRHFGRFGRHPSTDVLGGIHCEKHFYPWEKESFSSHLKAADVAIIPIWPNHRMSNAKPENKLILLWQLGIPVLTSATPAYVRTMANAGLDMTCAGLDEWRAALRRMIHASPAELGGIAKTGQQHAATAYSEAEFQARFDAAFALVGFDPG